MASSSSSSSSISSVQKSFKYDVFLSFRGEDTRKTFVDHLYHALQQKSIHTYKDDERIKKGERIGDELIKSIEDSKFYIIVFSRNYASSSWCLDELVKIMECQKTTEHTAYPVFYDVEPTEVRKQSGEFGKAFAKQEKEEAAEKWRETLKEASALAGWELKNTLDGHEAKFIKKIVEEISLELHSISISSISIDEKLVGMETRIKDVVSSLEMSIDDVRMIGIKGIGGGGKTTLARAVFDRISFRFEGSTFVENVRENSNPNLSGLKKLQEQVLKDVLHDKDIYVSSVSDGKDKMKKKMSCRKVLVVLDDVDHREQLEALAGELHWFKLGSRIIITTRDEQVLVAHGVELIRDVNLLSHEEAICLFNRYAFRRKSPIQEYKELSGQVVGYAGGLPLTITVLGSFLCGKDELEWKDAIERLKTIPSKETLEKLEISYIGLEEEHKEIFLDVACLLKRWKKKDAIRTLESCGFYARIGLRVLEQKSLITISEDGRLDMHDRIEEMGQYIVRKLEEPYKHSRLWINEEIEDVLVSDQGTNEAIRCIKLITSLNPEIVMKGIGNMKKLRFLQVNNGDWNYFDGNWKFDEDRPYFPNALRSLRWTDYPFGSLPKSFQANNLVQLNLRFSKIVQLWEGEDRKVLNKLRFLDLRYSYLKNLDLGLTKNLEILNLKGCYGLGELHMPAECPKLISLKVGNSKLTTLDLRAGTPNLKKLDLFVCADLVELHIPGECLKLESVEINGSKLRTLDLRGTPNLKKLTLDECVDLVELHIPGERLNLKSIKITGSMLRTLDLRGTPNHVYLNLYKCVDLVELHIPGEGLKLKSVKINGPKITTLDLRGIPNLEYLNLDECVDLVELHIPCECLKLESVEINGSKLRTLDLRGTPNLEKLTLDECVDLIELHIPGERLNLKSIFIKCSKLTILDLRGTPNLEKLTLYQCVDLVELHIPGEGLKLKSVKIDGSKLTTLDLRGTPNLEYLALHYCVDLVELHIPGERLKLKSIFINGSKLTTLDLRGTPNLQQLDLFVCVDLVELHIPGERLKLKSIFINGSKLTTLDLRGTLNLEKLTLYECVDLVELHIPDEGLKLKSVKIGHSKLTTLDLQGTPNLEYLTLQYCVDLVELHIPGERLKLKFIFINGSKLTTLDLRGTPNLEELTVKYCDDLVELHIPGERLKLKSIVINSSKLRTLDFRGTPNLKTLFLTKCFSLEEVHTHDGCLKNLACIELSGCLRFNRFLFSKKIESVEVDCVSKLHLKAESLEMCPLHSRNSLPKLRFECFYEEHGSSLIGNLEKLISFGFCACTNLERFSQSICSLQCLTKLTLEGSIPESPKDLDRLECLEELHLLSTKITHLPDSICKLKHLKVLKLESCWLLEKLPEDLGQLECLEKLILSQCVSLRHIPDSICMMKRLQYFLLPDCILVEKLPKEIGGLRCLKELNIAGTNIRQLPESISELNIEGTSI